MRETENIRASVVAFHIEPHAFAVDHRKIDVANDELLTVLDGFYHVTRIRP